MSGYEERAPRADVRFPVEFIAGDDRIHGTCENLSESGLLAKFAVPIEIWTEGEVNLHFGTDLLGVKVRVARVIELRTGLVFQYGDEQQRQKVRDLIRMARMEGHLLDHL